MKTQPIWKSFALTAAGTVALLPAFALWFSQIAGRRIAEFDLRISGWCRRPEQRLAWKLFSRIGDGWLYALYFLVLRYSGEAAQARKLAITCFLAWGIGSAVKITVRRKRANPIHRRHKILRDIGNWSFPSQHAAVAVGFAYALWPNPAAAILAGLVCCSRVLIGAHYLGDVLAGVVVGLVAGRLA